MISQDARTIERTGAGPDAPSWQCALVSSLHERLVPVGAGKAWKVGHNISSRQGLFHGHAAVQTLRGVSLTALGSQSCAGRRLESDVWSPPRASPGSTPAVLARFATVSAHAGHFWPAVALGWSLSASVRHRAPLLRTCAVLIHV